jgi:hypothetical protein
MRFVESDNRSSLSTKLDGLASLTVPLLVRPLVVVLKLCATDSDP